MLVKKFRDLYSVDRISQNKGWIKVNDAIKQIEQETEENIQIDFEGIKVVEPWDCPDFINLLKDKRIHMRFLNKDELVTRIKMTCIVNGGYADNIINIDVEKPHEKTAEEKKNELYGTGLLEYFCEDEQYPDALVLALNKKYTQIQNTNTVGYIQFAIDKKVAEGYKKFVILIGKMSVLDNVLECFARMIIKYKSAGVTVEVDLDDHDVITKMGLYLHKETAKEFSTEERAVHIKNRIKDGMPGMLIRYKKSKGLDDFGRFGKGEVISSRIAIIRSVEVRPKDRNIVAVVESYNNDYFYTRQQWMVEHDNEQLQSLVMDRLEIPVDELGFCDDFLGSSYHFLEPVPFDDTDNCKVIIAIDEDGRNVTKSCTLPERMRYVFDDWGIEYTQDDMDDFIERTSEIQGKPVSSKRKYSNRDSEEHKRSDMGDPYEFINAMNKMDELDDMDGLDDFDDFDDSEF